MTTTTAAGDILAELGLAGTPVAEARLVRAKVVAASPDVALLQVLGTDPYEAVMPVTEFYPRRWNTGETLVLEQLSAPPRPLVSAVRPELVTMAFDGFSPEVRSGQVRIMAVARHPGVRSKVAVATTDAALDPVAACVGRNANRVKGVASLLGGERVDVIAWHHDQATYLRNALAPAGVTRVEISGDKAVAVAPAHQMSAAVGSGGLNAALAGQLVGLRVVVVAEGSEEDMCSRSEAGV